MSDEFDSKREVTFFDEGETRISTSTWPQVGRAVAGLLSLPIEADGDCKAPHMSQFKNGYVYINSFTVNQKEMLESVMRVTNTKIEDWKISKEPVKQRYAAGCADLQSGNFRGIGKMLYGRIFFPDDCGNHEKTRGLQNEMLGLPKENIDDFTRIAIHRAANGII